jgi:membrane fusion protein (multidrug efflux system)
VLANLLATRSLQQAVIAQAEAGVSAAAAETQRSRDDAQRLRNLSATAAVSVQSSQRADADYKQAAANGQKAQALKLAAEREVDVIATRRQQALAALAQATAERDIARLNLGYTELRAPIDGTVGNRNARTGAYAAAGSHMMSIVPARGLWIDANFKESQLASFRPGMAATVEADAVPGRRNSTAMSPASRRPPARSSACCRPRTPRATSPRSSSAFRCASCSTTPTACSACCAPACP